MSQAGFLPSFPVQKNGDSRQVTQQRKGESRMKAENCLLIRVQISVWAPTKKDKKATTTVESVHHVSQVGQFSKKLLQSDALKNIGSLQQRVYQLIDKKTLPWDNRSFGIIPASEFFPLQDELNSYKAQFDAAVEQFVSCDYAIAIDEARNRLNGLFVPEDYPSQSELRKKFRFEIDTQAVPTDDLRVSVSDSEAAILKAQVQASIERRLNGALADLCGRLKERLETMTDTLADSKKVFRDSLIENIREMVPDLRKLNITNDSGIAKILNEVEEFATRIDLEGLRKSPTYRNDIQVEAAQAVVDLDKIMSDLL